MRQYVPVHSVYLEDRRQHRSSWSYRCLWAADVFAGTEFESSEPSLRGLWWNYTSMRQTITTNSLALTWLLLHLLNSSPPTPATSCSWVGTFPHLGVQLGSSISDLREVKMWEDQDTALPRTAWIDDYENTEEIEWLFPAHQARDHKVLAV